MKDLFMPDLDSMTQVDPGSTGGVLVFFAKNGERVAGNIFSKFKQFPSVQNYFAHFTLYQDPLHPNHNKTSLR